MSNKEIDTAVDQLLTANFVQFVVTYVGETKWNDSTCDAWRITMTGPNKTRLETSYHTGLGLRKVKKGALRCTARVGTVAYEQWAKQSFVTVSPSAASVLYCLLSDATALDTSFEYWCSDFGSDSDSIKAFDTYRACCEIGKQINAVMTRDLQKELRTLLEDY